MSMRNYCTIAVLGVPNRVAGSDTERFENELKSQGELRIEGRKVLRSTSARVPAARRRHDHPVQARGIRREDRSFRLEL
jgi:hypothetical protein